VLLIPQEDHPVREQCGAQLRDRTRVDITADPDAADDGSDNAADLRDFDGPVRAAAPRGRYLVMHLGHEHAPRNRYRPADSRRGGAFRLVIALTPEDDTGPLSCQ
jgi:hypothetical protein